MPGWNQRLPPGVTRCECAERRLWWARLSPEMRRGCCYRACCLGDGPPVVIMASREEILALRQQALLEGWDCPRCGRPVARHQRNFECLDQSVTRRREQKWQRTSARRR